MMKKLLLAAVLLSAVSHAQQNAITPASNLIVEGIPPIPATIASELKRYSESRSASFADWHPRQRSMLISTRFANVPQLHQVRFPLGDRRQITFFDEPITNASYEPVNGDYFLFNKDVGGNEFTQIYRYDVASGHITLLTDGGRSQNSGINWSNDGRRIAYGSTRRNGADRDIYLMDPRQPATDKMLCASEGGGWAVLDWAPGDRQLLVGEGISVNESHYWLVDVATGEKKPFFDRNEKGVRYGQAKFSRDGKGIYFTTDRENEFTRLAYVDLSTKKITYLSSSINWDVENFSLSEDGRQLAFLTNEAGMSRLYLLNTATRKFLPVKNLPAGVYGGVKFHNNSNDLAVSLNSARSASDVYVLSTSTGKVERWTESEMGGLVAEELNEPQLVKWKSFDGMEISGFYYRPSKKFTGKRPVIINIHGGPEGQSLPVFQGPNNYFLNEMGVAIIYPNVRGSLGYGKTFVRLDNGMKREDAVRDIGALISWIEKQPDLDASRIMVTGGSYGGYMTLAVATTYNDRIRCALDIVGISNFNTFLKNTESYRRDLRRVEYGDERDPQMAAYFDRTAPLNNAQKITRPMFIVQGGNDPRVPRTEAVQMVEKIKGNGGTVWYLEAKDEGHGFRKKNNIDYQRMATALFLYKYLLDGLPESKKTF